MNIGSIIGQLNDAISMNNLGGANTSSNLGALNENSINSLLDLPNGSFVSGEIVSVIDDKVQILLGNNEMVDAKLQSGINPAVGSNMSFMVSSDSNNQVLLTPLFENTNQMSTVNSALQASGLPNNPKMQYMVKAMMQEGLPIDRQSLYDMNKAVMTNPEADIKSLSQMKSLNIPLTKEMVNQFENYINLKQEISGTIADISDSLFDEDNLNSFIENNNVVTEGTKESLGQFLNIIDEFIGIEDSQISNEPNLMNIDNEIIQSQPLENEDALNALNDSLKEETQVREEQTTENVIKEFNSDSLKDADNKVANNKISNSADLTKNIDSLKDELKQAKSQDEVNSVLEKIKNTIKDTNFKDQFKTSLLSKFQLKPEDIAKEGEVTKTFNKMNMVFKNIAEELSDMGKADTPIAKSVNNVNSNIDFMNQLNQSFNYVQIPLKMLNQDASGELYVYSNKKSLARDDGSVSALLHLDMDNLGPVDVHVTLNELNNVKTKFYLKDDSALDLIAENIDTLNQRLEKRGYSMSSEFINKVDDKSVIETIVDDNKNISMISSKSFDARA
ncbi:MAG: flagellar hook-length control protein FliK [Lachnospiraceae bacterium]|nr:flagellar hook-length control protein FliK [Lachnospiraceae bacterium]